jgi:hypothetical protein
MTDLLTNVQQWLFLFTELDIPTFKRGETVIDLVFAREGVKLCDFFENEDVGSDHFCNFRVWTLLPLPEAEWWNHYANSIFAEVALTSKMLLKFQVPPFSDKGVSVQVISYSYLVNIR